MLLVIFSTAILFFTSTIFTNFLDLTSQAKANIGIVISGITAPIVGIFTSILLYLTLTAQTQSSNDQRLKNESDVIFLLMNQFYSEVQNFTHLSIKAP